MKHHPRRRLTGLVAVAALLAGAGTSYAAPPATAAPAPAAPTEGPPTPGAPTLAPAEGAYLEGRVDVVSDATTAGDPVTEIAVDGQPLDATETRGVSWLSFQVGSNSVEARYGNVVRVNGHAPITLPDAVSEEVVLEVPNEQLVAGRNAVEFATGTVESSCGVNNDDFTLSEIRLTLLGEAADGEENEFSYDFGDGDCGSNKSKRTRAELFFNIAGEPGATTGLRTDLDTTTLENGSHEITATARSGAAVTHRVRVNNAAPGAPRITPVDGTLVAGEQSVFAAGRGGPVDLLTVDGEQPTAPLTLADGVATLAFTVGSNSIEAKYFNHLLVNGRRVDLGGDWVSERVELRLPQRYLVPGENDIRLVTGDVNSGSGATLCANRDDFTVSDVSLTVESGTVTPVDPAPSYAMGDGTCGSNTALLAEAPLRFTIADADTTRTQRTLGAGEAHLSFFVGGNGTEARYGNHVLVNGLRRPLGDHVGETVDLAFPNEWLQPGVNVVEYVAGAIPSSCGDNYDDFLLTAHQLVPAAGSATLIHRTRTTAGAEVAVSMGDGSCGTTHNPTLRAAVTFRVDASAEGLRADLDTRQLADGPHVVAAASGELGARRTLLTDNTGPQVAASVPAAGDLLLDEVAFDLRLDDLAGVAGTPTTTLDGQPIALGDPVGHGLSAGEHVLEVTATDTLGNQATRRVTFRSGGIPDVPTELSPGTGTEGVDGEAELSARLSVPGGGEVTGTFSRAAIVSPRTGYQGTADAVPTTLRVAGEVGVDTRSLRPLAKGAVDAPPARGVTFQRFDLDVSGREGQPVLQWRGVVDPERLVVLRAWSTSAGAWQVLTSARGSVEGETVLTARVPSTLVDRGVVHVMVTGEDPFADDIEPGDPNGFADPAAYDFSLVHFTDTQYLSEGAVEQETAEERAIWRAAYGATTEWIAANAAERKISYVAHTGDIIENNYYAPTTPEMEAQVTGEFEVSSQLQGTLDRAGVPNQVIAGNHDNQLGTETGPDSRYNRYYGPERYDAVDETWQDASYGGPWKEGDNQNNYVLFSAGGLDFVAVGLSYGVTREEASWASSVFARFPERNGILLSHDYLKPSSSPDGRGALFSAPDGSLLYKRVVENNPNVFLVLAGHEHGVGTNLKTGIGATVRHDVVELLADYQFYTVSAERLGLTGIGGYQPTDRLRFGASFLRLLQFDVERGEMIVDTYSPFLDEFGATEYDTEQRYDGTEDNMVLPVDLTSRRTSLRTDTLAAYLPQEVVGTDTVSSGEVASVTWTGLAGGTTYAWMVSATSAGGGRAVAEPAVFGTVPGSTPPPGPPADPDAPTLTARAGAVGYGQAATVTVGVTDRGTPVETGTVTVREGQTVLGEAPVAAGTATVTIPAGLRPGTHQLTATYAGSLPPASTALALVVERGSATVTASADPVVAGEPATVSVSVDGAGLPAAGEVEVREGGTVLGRALLTEGAAEVALPRSLATGEHALVVGYAGSDLLAPASTPLTLTVTAPAKVASEVRADGPSAVRARASFTLRVRVTAGGQVPSGTVVVTRRGEQVGRGTLDARGRLRLELRAPARPGPKRFGVAYLGSAQVAPSEGVVLVQVRARRG